MNRMMLLIAVMLCGILVGAGLYEALAIVPLWAGGPPESLVAFNTQPLKPLSGPRFWMFATPLVGLVCLVNLFFAWRSRDAARAWWIAGSAGFVAMIVVTFIFFVPLLMKIYAVGVGGEPVPGESVQLWATLNWVRTIVLVISWFCLVRAFGGGAGSPRGEVRAATA